MAGIEKDHWPWNTRANDTKSIVEGFSQFIRFAAERRLLWPPAKITQLTIARVPTYLSAFSTLRRNHHWVVGYRLSGRSSVFISIVLISYTISYRQRSECISTVLQKLT
jgi:hypothetical protein